MDRMKPQDIFEAVERIENVPAGDREFTGPTVPDGKVVRLESFYAVDESTAAKEIILGFRRGNVVHVLKHETCGTGVYGLALLTPLILVEGEQPYALIKSATANDEITFYARGPYL
jgi:hypothetical protein